MPLTVVARLEEDIAILDLSGSLTLGPHVALLRRTVRQLLADQKVRGFIVNAAEVIAVDSSGLGELTLIYSLISGARRQLILAGPSAGLGQMLAMTHLDELLPTAPDVAAAQKRLKRP